MPRILLISAVLMPFLAAAEDLAIVNGTLVNTDGSVPVENAAIVIRDDTILAAGRRADIDIPSGSTIVDARGKWIIPGLIDSHVHFFQSGGLYTRPDVIDLRSQVPYVEGELAQIRQDLPDTFARYLASGVTTVVDVGGPFWNFEVRARAEASPAAPRVVAAGPLISTYQPRELTTDDPPIVRIETPAAARKMVRRQARANADLIKIWYIVDEGEHPRDHLPIVEATIAESDAHGLPVAVHATQLETARLAVAAGADILVHSVTDKPVDAAFIDLLRQHDVVYTTTLTVFEGYPEVLTQQVRLTAAEHRLGNPRVIASWFDLRELPESALPPGRLDDIENPPPLPRDTVAMHNAKALQDAGIALAAGTDAGNIGTLHGPAVFREYELLAEAGLTPAEILQAATVNGARLAGLEDEVGTITVGKQADIVILNANPLEDIRNTAAVHRVIRGGRLFRPKALLDESPADIVQRQLNAYNARDIDAFVATYADDIEFYDHPDTQIARGRTALRERYGDFFANTPQLHARLVDRMTLGRFVIDREHVTGLAGGGGIHAVAIYEVTDGLIEKVWLLREESP